MDLIGLLLLINAIINILLGITVFIIEPKDRAHIYFALISLSVAGWCFGMFFYRGAISNEEALIFARLLYAAAAMMPLFFVQFTINFPLKPVISFLVRAALYLVSIVILAFSLLSNGVVAGVTFNKPHENILMFGGWYLVYFVYIVTYFMLGFTILGFSFRRAHGIERKQIQYVFWGTFIASNLGMLTNLILPSLDIFYFNWLGNLLSISMVGFITFAILKHHLFNVKVIATELLVFLIWVAVFVEVILADNLTDRLIELGLFFAVIVVGVLIIRSVLKEVQQKEEFEKLSKALAAANERLKKLDEAKSEFISIASHQLRTPLTAIKGYISMMLEGDFGVLTKEERSSLGKVSDSSERLIRLVEDLLNISRIESGRLQFNFTEVSLEEMVGSVVEELSQAAAKKGLRFNYLKPPAPLSKVRIDEEKIRQVVMNLTDNAVKYTKKGSVTVSLREADGLVEFCVADSGMGVSKKDLSNLFQKFSRGTGTSLIHTEGTGLGLYVAKMMMESHRGRIWAESDGEGRGSKFCFTLPVVNAVSDSELN